MTTDAQEHTTRVEISNVTKGEEIADAQFKINPVGPDEHPAVKPSSHDIATKNGYICTKCSVSVRYPRNTRLGISRNIGKLFVIIGGSPLLKTFVLRLNHPQTDGVNSIGSSPRLTEDAVWGTGFPPGATRESATRPTPPPGVGRFLFSGV